MRIFPFFIPHAGCRQRCIYCNQKVTSRQSGIPNPEEIVQSVTAALEHGLFDEVAYYGGSFTALPVSLQDVLLDALQPFLAAGKVGGIRVSTRPGTLAAETVDRLRQAGVKTVELGCQSFDAQVLEASGRGHTAADAAQAVWLLREAGLRCGVQLMPGLPQGSRAEALASLADALHLGPDFLRIYPTVVLAGTELATLWRQQRYTPLLLDQAVELCAEMAVICQQADMPVIRYGLQANECLATGAVLAGPYHPAFGQLVRSRLWRKALQRLVDAGITRFAVHPNDLADALGHRRGNLAGFGPISLRPRPGIGRGFIDTGAKNIPVASLLT